MLSPVICVIIAIATALVFLGVIFLIPLNTKKI